MYVKVKITFWKWFILIHLWETSLPAEKNTNSNILQNLSIKAQYIFTETDISPPEDHTNGRFIHKAICHYENQR